MILLFKFFSLRIEVAWKNPCATFDLSTFPSCRLLWLCEIVICSEWERKKCFYRVRVPRKLDNHASQSVTVTFSREAIASPNRTLSQFLCSLFPLWRNSATTISSKSSQTFCQVFMVLLAMDSSNNLSSSPTHLDGGGNWSAVVQAKKGKGKKKLKNARTLSLQTFFSQHGGQENDNFDDMPRDNQDGQTPGNLNRVSLVESRVQAPDFGDTWHELWCCCFKSWVPIRHIYLSNLGNGQHETHAGKLGSING